MGVKLKDDDEADRQKSDVKADIKMIRKSRREK